MHHDDSAQSQYTYQLAFTNPLYDPIQIRLHPSATPDPKSPLHIHLPTQHFTVNPLKDAWAYDDYELDDDPTGSGSQLSEEASSVAGRKPRSSLAGGTAKTLREVLSGSVRKREKDGVERKGNISMVGLEVEVDPRARGRVEVDLEVRLTYRAEAEDGQSGAKEHYKVFTFWVRAFLGMVE